jgi:hypothetical protein
MWTLSGIETAAFIAIVVLVGDAGTGGRMTRTVRLAMVMVCVVVVMAVALDVDAMTRSTST